MAEKKTARKKPLKKGGARKKLAGTTAAAGGQTIKIPATSRRPGVRINARLKGLTIAAEPPIDANTAHLSPGFRAKLTAALTTLSDAGTPFKLVEGFRTVARQQWLYGSGRPNAQPYGRPGPILTNADGVTTISKHQGTGAPGTGVAADCYPTRNGSVYIPSPTDPVWDAYASAVEDQGLVAGHNWPNLKDSPHCEEG